MSEFQKLLNIFQQNGCSFSYFSTKNKNFDINGLASQTYKNYPGMGHNFRDLVWFSEVRNHTVGKIKPGACKSFQLLKKYRQCEVNLVFHADFDNWTQSAEASFTDFLFLLSASLPQKEFNSFTLPPNDTRTVLNGNIVIINVINFQQAFMFSIPRGKQSLSLITGSTPVEALISLKHTWLALQSNFNQAIIPIKTKHSKAKCHYFRAGRESFSRDACSLQLLEQKLNFTLDTGRNWSVARQTVIEGTNIIGAKRNGSFWLPHGMRVKAFGFILVFDKSRIKFKENALIPFDKMVWFLLVLSNFGVASVFFLCYHYFRHKNRTKLLQKILRLKFLLMQLLLDQSANYKESKRRKWNNFQFSGYILMLLWAVWAFGCFIISQTYRADIFSILATTKDPSVPETFPDLLKSDRNVLLTTLEKCSKNRTDLSCVKYISSDVLESYNSNVPAQFKILKDSVHWIKLFDSYKWAEVVYSLKEKKSLPAKLPGSKRDEMLELHRPPKFALLDMKQELQVFAQSLKYFESKYWPSKLLPIPALDRKTLWVIKGRRYHLIFGTYLGRVHEAGFSTRFESQEQVYKLVYKLRKSFLKLMRSQGQSVEEAEKSEISWKFLSCVEGCAKARQLAKESFTSVSKSVYRSICLYWAVGAGIAVISMLVELLVRKLAKKRKTAKK